MKIAVLCLVVLLGLSVAQESNAKTVQGLILEQLPYKLMEWTSGFLMGMRNKEHYTTGFQFYNL